MYFVDELAFLLYLFFKIYCLQFLLSSNFMWQWKNFMQLVCLFNVAVLSAY